MEKSCRECVHQLMCAPFRKIEKIFLNEDTFRSTRENRHGDVLYETIADMCDEYLGKGA